MSKSDKFERHNKDKYIVGGIFILLMLAGGVMIWLTAGTGSGPSATTSPIATINFATSSVPTSTPEATTSVPAAQNLSGTDKLAICLAQKGVTMYGAVWCPHCQDQKKLFGDSFKYAKYVECPDNIQLCLSKGIEGYPTWLFPNGQKLEGLQTLAKLAEVSGCPLSK